MWTLVRLTLREMLNKKVLFLGLALTVVYLGLYGFGLYYMGKDLKNLPEVFRLRLAADMLCTGLYISGMMVAGLTIFTSVGAISTEIENGVMQGLAAKPVARRDIFLGKLVGLGLILVAYSLLVFLVINFMTQFFLGLEVGHYLFSLGLFCLQPLVILAVTMWGSSFLSTLGNGIVVFMLYSISVVGGITEQIGSLVNSSLVTVGIVTSLLMPVDAMYRLVNFSLVHGGDQSLNILSFNPFSTQTPPSVWMIVYTGIYFLFFIWLGNLVFTRRDI